MSGVTLLQIINRARTRAERADGVLRCLFSNPVGERAEFLMLQFLGDRVMVAFKPLDPERATRGFIPRKLLAQAASICSSKDPTAQWVTMRALAPHAPYRLLNALVELWRPWVLKDLDLMEAEA